MNIFNYIAEGLFSHIYGFLRAASNRRDVEALDDAPVPSQMTSNGIKKYIHQLRLEATLEYLSATHIPRNGATDSELSVSVRHGNYGLMFDMADRLERQMMYATRQPVS